MGSRLRAIFSSHFSSRSDLRKEAPVEAQLCPPDLLDAIKVEDVARLRLWRPSLH